MLSRNIRFVSLLTRMPFTTTATEIDYEKIQKDLNRWDIMLALPTEFQAETTINA